MDFENRVRLREMRFTDTEDDIADYIRKNKAVMKQVSIQKISADLYTSPNAVMRFAKKLGYSGFSELKIALSNDENKMVKTLSRQLLETLPNNIVRTLDTIDDELLHRVAILMHQARCCIFAGVGDSTYFCEILGKNLRCLECNVQYYQQIHDMVYAVQHGNETDLLVVISARGMNQRLNELAALAKEKGMTVVSLTHCAKNALEEIADVNLYFWGEERIVGGYNVTDRSGLIVLVRLLSEAFWNLFGAGASFEEWQHEFFQQ